MSQRKGSSRTFNGPGSVQHLAKQIQRDFKLTYAAAKAQARIALGMSPMDVSIGSTATLLSVAFTSEVVLNGATAASYAWDFGDTNTDTTEDATNVYAGAGTYTVTCTVTDTLGLTSMGSTVVTVVAA
jgi:PKD repeat protein